jgi:ComF family protein
MELWRIVARNTPRACLVCGVTRGVPLVCSECAADFFATQQPACERCAGVLSVESPICGRCSADPPHFDRTVALAIYRAPIDGLIGALKFGHRLEVAAALGTLLAPHAAPLFDRQALLTAVPLAFERLAQRGFNQSLEIARAAAAALGTSVAPNLLLRVRHAPPQTSLDRAARRANVRGAFAVTGPVRDRRVFVVDDVLTTGSTLDEIARVLKAAGARCVVNLVVARTP